MQIKAFLLLIIISINYLSSTGEKLNCERKPEGSGNSKSPPDGRFRLRIINDPIRFTPGESYNISIEGVTRYSALSPQKFTGFFLTVERATDDEKSVDWRQDDDDSLGKFTVLPDFDALAKISPKCKKVVTHSNSVAKSEVIITWSAPLSLKGCVIFRSTIIEHRDIWFSDDGPLSKKLCEDEADSGDFEPVILNECTACDEAKYELTFEGMWSRNTHPKDFPDDGWQTRFTDLIGASYAVNHAFWKYGEKSSEGMKNMAEHGDTSKLEEELKEKGENVRTIIKARGISYPNVNGKTFAVFRVDSNHHLISIVSKVYPSPDWFVGVSDIELCLLGGKWLDHKEINLYPFDAGTDSGATYISPDQPTLPSEAIRRIKPNMPNDPRSPFYDQMNREMRPLAKLYITRQRLYEKTCENVNEEDENGENENEEEEGEEDQRERSYGREESDPCETNNWGQWSECNNGCGDGIKMRKRYYKNSLLATNSGCKVDLVETEECKGFRTCQDKTQQSSDGGEGEGAEEGDAENDPECKLSEWAAEEECSCENGQGEKKFQREYVMRRNRKMCMKKYPDAELNKSEPCKIVGCDGNQDETSTVKTGAECPLMRWSKWSKCSTTCGRGQQIRVRKSSTKALNTNDVMKQMVILYNKFESGHNSIDDVLNLEFSTVSDPDHKCYGTELVQVQNCTRRTSNYPQCENEPEYICSQPPMRGDCHQTPDIRYYYSHKHQKCGIFYYTGCEGSKNNFLDYASCQATCERQSSIEDEARSDSLVDQVYELRKDKINCQLSQWKYTPCNSTCGEGYRWKFRQIIRRPENGGKLCPMKLRQLERCDDNDDCEPIRVIRPLAQIRTTTTTTVRSIHCDYSEWSAWTPCSKSCGQSAIQIRTRSLQNFENSAICVDRLQERPCPVMPCRMENNYNNRHRNDNY